MQSAGSIPSDILVAQLGSALARLGTFAAPTAQMAQQNRLVHTERSQIDHTQLLARSTRAPVIADASVALLVDTVSARQRDLELMTTGRSPGVARSRYPGRSRMGRGTQQREL